MDWLQTVALAIIQGLTEFLPISSSAHLILPHALLGWPDQGLAFDVAVHVGSLMAVLHYFRADLRRLAAAWFQQLGGGPATTDSLLVWWLGLATIPVALIGWLLDDWIEQHLRAAWVIGLTTLGFGLLLGFADWRGARRHPLASIGWRQALVIGLAQVLALIPGTSRSGITMTAGLMLGLQREAAARFSFLLAIPVIALSGGYKTVQLLGAEQVPWLQIVVGTVLAAVSAWLCIHLFLRWIERVGMWPFVIYRLLLGGVLLLFFA